MVHSPKVTRFAFRSLLAGVLLLGEIATGCRRADSGPTATGPVYAATPAKDGLRAQMRIAIHPLHNPSRLVADYQPLVDLLNARIPEANFTVEASRDYQEYERKIAAREPEFLLPNPWQSLEAMKAGYTVIAMAGEPRDFKGLFIVRRDAGIRQVSDLRGKAASYPSPTALAACIMPQWFLHTHGLDVNRDIENRYVGSQESAIMNVYLQLTAVGVTWPPPWREFVAAHPNEAAQLEVAWETETLVNNAVMVRRDLPATLGERVRAVLLALDGTAAGRAILAGIDTARFLPATDADYEQVRQFVARFEAEVRPVKGVP
jgi:phosphonate transport system substrate-binding protein